MNDYKVGDKFVAEITDSTEHIAIIKLNGTDKIEIRIDRRDLDELQLHKVDTIVDEQAKKLWYIVKKIFLANEDGGLPNEKIKEIFGKFSYDIVKSCTFKDILDAWDNRKDIQIGDIVTTDLSEEKALIIDATANKYVVYNKNCTIGLLDKDICKKTGRTIDVRSIAEQIGE